MSKAFGVVALVLLAGIVGGAYYGWQTIQELEGRIAELEDKTVTLRATRSSA